MKNRVLSFLLILFVGVSFAQEKGEKIISGTVSDNMGPLPGATVLIKGTFRGVETSLDGAYFIQAKVGDVLVYRFIGMKTVEKKIMSDSNVINVNMKEDSNILTEIIITGQGSGMEKKKLSTTVDALSAKEIEKLPANQIDLLLQSTTPSAQIRMSSGEPGKASIIRTRGPISASSSTTPVIIVDGVRVDNLNSKAATDFSTGGSASVGFSALGDIPMESIEKIEYIKGGAATTLYGADAANGVIQIITKKGKAGETNVFFETRTGIVKGTQDFLRFKRTGEALFKTGLSQEYRVGINGGNEKITYNFAGGLYKNDSYTKLNELIKRAVSFGVKANVSDDFEYQGSFSFTNVESKADFSGNTGYSRFGEFEKGKRGNLDELKEGEWGEVMKASDKLGDNVDISRGIMRFTNSNKFIYNFSDKFSSSATIGLDYRDETNHLVRSNAFLNSYSLFTSKSSKNYVDRAEMSRMFRKNLVVTGDVNLTYKFDWKGFSSVSILGGQFFRTNDKQTRLIARQGIDVPGTYSSRPYASKNENYFVLQNANYGLYFLQNIGIKDLAFIELGGRLDENTSAGKNTSAIFLPKLGFVYNISDHDFYKQNSFSDIVSNLKLRANYGEATNFARPFSQMATLSINTLQGKPTLSFSNPGNKELISERLKTYEFGIDVGLFRRVNIGLTRYISKTTDALFEVPSMPSSGEGDQIKNVGIIKNKGWELALNTDIIKGGNHNLSFNASYNYNENKVEDMKNAPGFKTGGFGKIGSWVEEGQSLGVLKGNSAEKQQDGTYKIIKSAYLGNTFAPHFGSFGLNYSFKNFSLFVLGDYQLGGKVADINLLLRHMEKVDRAGVPDELYGKTTHFNYINYFIKDNDFVKIRNIGLSYDFKRTLVYFSNVRLGLTVTNPFNWVSSDIDPEVTGSGITSQNGFASGGFYLGTQSAPRIYMTSIKFQF